MTFWIAAGLALLASGPVRAQDWDRLAGIMSGVTKFQTVVIQDEAAWLKLWSEHRRTSAAGGERILSGGAWRRYAPIAASAAPPVDFARDIVVGVFLGRRPTTGYSVEIELEPAAAGDDTETVVYREIPPPPDTLQATIVTSPFMLVKLPKTAASVRVMAADPPPASPAAEKSADHDAAASALRRRMDRAAGLLQTIPRRELADR